MTNRNIVDAIEDCLSNKDMQKFLVTVKTGKIVHVNMTILDHFLNKRKARGLYMSIDRPHKYIELLLRKKRIPQDNIIYVDVATRAAGDASGRSLLSIGGFLWLKILSNTFDDIYLCNSKKCDKVDFFSLDFIVIDNASVLPAYNTLDSIREFFAEFGNVIRDHKNLRAFIVTPKDLHPKMYETLRNFVDKIIDIPDGWLR